MYKRVLVLFFAICLPIGLIAVVIAANTNSVEPEELQVIGTSIIEEAPPMPDESQEQLRAVGRSAFDLSPLYIVFCPVEKTISVYDTEGRLVEFRDYQDEDAFWTLVETNARVTGYLEAGISENRNKTIFDNDGMSVTNYDSEGIRTVISFDKNMFELPDMPDEESSFFRHEVLQSVVWDPDVLNDFETITEYDNYGNSVITVIVEETFFEDFINESFHLLSNQELYELYAPFRAIGEAISDTYELNWTFFDAYYPTGRYFIIRELERSLLSLSLEEYEKNLRELVPFFLLDRLTKYIWDLVNIEYDAGIISREQMIELHNTIFRSDGSYDQVLELKETILQKLQLTLPRSDEILEDMENVIYLLQNFR